MVGCSELEMLLCWCRYSRSCADRNVGGRSPLQPPAVTGVSERHSGQRPQYTTSVEVGHSLDRGFSLGSEIADILLYLVADNDNFNGGKTVFMVKKESILDVSFQV